MIFITYFLGEALMFEFWGGTNKSRTMSNQKKKNNAGASSFCTDNLSHGSAIFRTGCFCFIFSWPKPGFLGMINKAGSAIQIKLCPWLTRVRLQKDSDPARGSQLKCKVSPDEHTSAQTQLNHEGKRDFKREREVWKGRQHCCCFWWGSLW